MTEAAALAMPLGLFLERLPKLEDSVVVEIAKKLETFAAKDGRRRVSARSVSATSLNMARTCALIQQKVKARLAEDDHENGETLGDLIRGYDKKRSAGTAGFGQKGKKQQQRARTARSGEIEGEREREGAGDGERASAAEPAAADASSGSESGSRADSGSSENDSGSSKSVTAEAIAAATAEAWLTSVRSQQQGADPFIEPQLKDASEGSEGTHALAVVDLITAFSTWPADTIEWLAKGRCDTAWARQRGWTTKPGLVVATLVGAWLSGSQCVKFGQSGSWDMVVPIRCCVGEKQLTRAPTVWAVEPNITCGKPQSSAVYSNALCKRCKTIKADDDAKQKQQQQQRQQKPSKDDPPPPPPEREYRAVTAGATLTDDIWTEIECLVCQGITDSYCPGWVPDTAPAKCENCMHVKGAHRQKTALMQQ